MNFRAKLFKKNTDTNEALLNRLLNQINRSLSASKSQALPYQVF